MKYHTIVNGETYVIDVKSDSYLVVNGEEIEIDFTTINAQGLYSLIVGQQSFEAVVDRVNLDNWQISLSGQLYEVEIYEESVRLLQQKAGLGVAGDGEVNVVAPMPGLVLDIPISEGDVIEVGDNVIILESMKMENELKAPRGGTIAQINVAKGDSVNQNQVLIVIE